MRLFIAVALNDGLKDQIHRFAVDTLGSDLKLTEKQNLHITMNFLGEVDYRRLPLIKDAMIKAAAGAEPFEIMTGNIGAFKSYNDKTVYLGVKDNTSLSYLYTRLCEELEKAGFAVEKRAFRPHITIARRFTGVIPRSANIQTVIPVDSFTLFESTREKGALLYRDIDTILLKK